MLNRHQDRYMPLPLHGYAPDSDIVTPRLLSEVAARFDLVLLETPRGYAFPGSPERCVSRHVVRAHPAHVTAPEASLWMVERLAPGQASRRGIIGSLIARLARDGLSWVPAPRAVRRPDRETGDADPCTVLPQPLTAAHTSGPDSAQPHQKDEKPHMRAYVLDHAGFPWQVTPFIEGAPLPRPDYLGHGWRGAAVAACILDLVHAGGALETIPPAEHCDDGRQGVVAYVKHMVSVIAERHPGIRQRLAPVLPVMETLPDVLASQPVVLAHGDLHPLNIIWKGDVPAPDTAHRDIPGTPGRETTHHAIAGVIDWEFAGARPLLYDAANCVGCVGFEHPSGLRGPFVLGLVHTLHRGGISADMLRLLPDMVIASRFGWLSEWLRKRDHEMLEMELDYFDILVHQRRALADLWGTSGAAS